MQRVTNYCLTDAWFNDYQEIYPYMLYYADAANEGQKILRYSWVPLFSVSPVPQCQNQCQLYGWILSL